MAVGDTTSTPIFEGAIATSTTTYLGVPIVNGTLGLDIGWTDATSAATITIEFTQHGATTAPYDAAGDAWEWKDSGETITGPTGAAAGGTLVHFENVRQRRARLKIVTTANSDFVIYAQGR